MKPAPLLLALLFACTPAWTQEAAKPHVDWEGNPLPAEAVARIGSTRFRTSGLINALALSPDGKTLACLCNENTLHLLDATSGKHLQPISEGTGSLFSQPGALLRFQADGKAIVIVTRGLYRVVDLQSGKELRKVTIPQGFETTLSEDGTRLAVGRGSEIVVHDLKLGKELCKFAYESLGKTPGIAFTPDGRSVALASCSKDGIQVFDATTGQLKYVLPQPNALRLAISPDGSRLAASIEAGPFGAIWDIANRKLIGKTGVLSEFTPSLPVVFSPTGKHVFFGGWRGPGSGIVDGHSGKLIHRLNIWEGGCPVVQFSSNGKKLYAASMNSIQGWDVASAKPLQPALDPWAPYHFTLVRALAPHGSDLLLSGNPMTIADWRTGRPLRRIRGLTTMDPSQAVLSPDEKWIAFRTGDGDTGQISLMSSESGKVVRDLKAKGEEPWFLRFTPNSKQLICLARSRAMYCWDLPTGNQVFRSVGAGEDCWFVSSPDGRKLATFQNAGEDRQATEIRIWNTGHDSPFRTIALGGLRLNRVDFSMDGNMVILASEGDSRSSGRIDFLDAKKGRVIKSLVGESLAYGGALSPDGRTLCSGSKDSKLSLWELSSGKVRHQIVGHAFSSQDSLFHRDGSLLAAASADAPIFLWDVYGKHLNKKPPVEQWSDADGQRHWDTLASDDAAKAFGAIRGLVQNPRAALKLLDQRLQSVKPIEERRFTELVKALDDENFAKRKKALVELEQLADQVEGWLLRETEAKQPLEVQRRLEQIVAKLDARNGDSLRGTRALEVLEQIGGAEAERLVTRIADGFAAARLTREAKETRERMRQLRGK